ncbi:spore germination protein [Anaeromicropila populeti]|uniref:Spore germination protein KA n=1 Tax=Anaeromicropila populeti TaxID=37658 RepID=A0A1I6JVJ5_9FIRM|nr:spore germination protein [Anaeromicropila populeti]SFR83014.1 spore germination protein KA [Anaeromicropila populeti]
MKKVIQSKTIKELFSKSTDILVRPIELDNPQHLTVHLFCVDGLVNSQLLDLAIMKPIGTEEGSRQCKTQAELANYLLNHGGAYHAFGSEITDFDKLITVVMSGMAAVIFDQLEKAIVFDVRTFDKRSIQEPSEEGVMKGAKDSFIEVLRTNTALIRRRVRSPYLVIEQMWVGRMSRTDVALVYISNLCDMNLVEQLRKKLQAIDIDNIAAASFIEEYLIENKGSLLPQVMYTQRPDRCASNLTDGRISIIIDGIPFVYVLPCQLPMLLQSPEDYSENYIASSSFRILRYATMILSLLLPAFYIAITTFHNQLLPVQMILSIQEAKAKVPFSSWVEVLGLLFSFEILIEAGLRLPKPVGQAMSIVGGLVVGQAAVTANIISPVVVIVVALTGIAGFTVPNQDLSIALRISRFALGILASFAGFFGLMAGIIYIVTHLCSLDNFGIAYLSPFVDCKNMSLQDTIFRYPVENFKYRPDGLAKNNHRKQK